MHARTEEPFSLVYVYSTVISHCKKNIQCNEVIQSLIRSKSGANHLNNVIFTNMHKEQMDVIDIEGIAREFVRKNEARQLFFGRR